MTKMANAKGQIVGIRYIGVDNRGGGGSPSPPLVDFFVIDLTNFYTFAPSLWSRPPTQLSLYAPESQPPTKRRQAAC